MGWATILILYIFLIPTLILEYIFIELIFFSSGFSLTPKICPTVMATQKQAYFPILSGKGTTESIAEQLTLFEYDIIRNIRIHDVLKDGALLDQEQGVLRNSFTIYSNHSQRMRDLFISEIINESSPKLCKEYIKKAICIAELCFNLRNYNTVMEILSALYSPLILTNCEKSLEEVFILNFQAFFFHAFAFYTIENDILFVSLAISCFAFSFLVYLFCILFSILFQSRLIFLFC